MHALVQNSTFFKKNRAPCRKKDTNLYLVILLVGTYLVNLLEHPRKFFLIAALILQRSYEVM